MATKEYPNFYENIKEANMRLQHTVVLYDGAPYYVLCICDGHSDGIFRVYMAPTGHEQGLVHHRTPLPVDWHGPGAEKMKMLDDMLKKMPEEGVLRKHMNSPLFNKFRPFPLGMCNVNGKTVYLERQPQRQTFQGLSQQHIYQSLVTLGNKDAARLSNIDYSGGPVRSTILGDYPTFDYCLKGMKDPDVSNETVAFHRHFALARGPADTLFLIYKTDVVGMLPTQDKASVRIPHRFGYVKEVVSELGVFNEVVIG